MAPSADAESERWIIVLVVVERDGSLVLVIYTSARLGTPPLETGRRLARTSSDAVERHIYTLQEVLHR